MMSMSQPTTPENRRTKVSWRRKLLKGSGSRGGGLEGDNGTMGWISPSTSSSSTNEGGSPRAKGWKMGGGHSNYSGEGTQPASELGTPRKSGMGFLGLLHKTRTPNSESSNMGMGMGHFGSPELFEASHEVDGLFNGSASPFVCSTSLALYQMTTPKMGTKGPQVKPFIFTQAHQTATNRQCLGARCLICDEHLEAKLQDEKIVDLKCGDFVHSECFQITINYEIERLVETVSLSSTSDQGTLIQQIFPRCNGRECLSSCADKPMLPVDEGYVDEIIVNALIAQQYHESKSKNINLAALSSTLESNKIYNSNSKLQYDSLNTVNPLSISTQSKHPRPGFLSYVSEPTIPTHQMKPGSGVSLVRESSIKTRSPSPNSSISTISTETIKINNYRGVSMETLKDHFIQYLIDNCLQFSLSTLLKLGPLRLVDELLVSTSNLKSFKQKICYLFTNYLVIWILDGLSPLLFPLDPGNLSIGTLSASILKMRTTDSNSFFKEIMLNSEIDSIIEKWVVAVSDFSFNFPSDVLTSTIILPQYKKKSYYIDDFLFSKPSPRRNSSNTVSSAKKSNSTIDVIQIDDTTPTISKLSFPSPSKIGVVYADSDYDSDSDLEKIATTLRSKNNNIRYTSNGSSISMNIAKTSRESQYNEDSDNDDDSDQELIDNILKETNEKQSADCRENGWNALFADIALALVNNQNY